MRRLWWRRLANVLGVLAGMPALMACLRSLYGEPPVEIKNFGYQPPSPIHVGDTLTFTAELPVAGMLGATAYAGRPVDNSGLRVELHDDGVAPDKLASDGIYTGAGVWLAEYGRYTMQTKISAQGEVNGKPCASSEDGPPLEVLP